MDAPHTNQGIGDRLANHPVVVGIYLLSSAITILGWFYQIVPSAWVTISLLALCFGIFILILRPSGRIAAADPMPAPTAPAAWQPIWTADSDQVFIPPDESVGQHLYADIFNALAQGQFSGGDGALLIAIGRGVASWVDRQYTKYVRAYPGARGDRLKFRFYEMAYQRIKSGKMLDAHSASQIIPVVDAYVSTEFAKRY